MILDPVGIRQVGGGTAAGPTLVITNAKLQALHGYWLQARGQKEFPAPTSFEFGSLRTWLGHVALVEVCGEPPKFRFRLYGTRLAEVQGKDHSGAFLDQAFSSERLGAALVPYQACLKYRAPIAFANRFRKIDESLVLEQLLLPCSSDQTTINFIVGASYLTPEGVG